VKEDPKRPFFAYIAPKAAHEPFNPAPWYRDHWDASWPQHEPRPANWNCSKEMREKHPGVVATEAMIDDEAAAVITDVFKNRWRTLMSVDDVIAGVIATCEELQIMNTTYFFYTSDHGFQLGQFNIIMDKRHVYDWDTHIHLLARGPGILPGSRFPYPATQVDLAPTFLGLAGLSVPQYMDGKSLVPLLVTVTPTSTPTTTTTTTTTPTTYSDMQGNGNAHRKQNKNNSNSTKSASSTQKEMEIEMEMEFPVLPATLKHLRSLPRFAQYAASWRQAVFIEYYFNSANTKCCGGCTNPKGTSGYPHKDAWCGDLSDNTQVKKQKGVTLYKQELELLSIFLRPSLCVFLSFSLSLSLSVSVLFSFSLYLSLSLCVSLSLSICLSLCLCVSVLFSFSLFLSLFLSLSLSLSLCARVSHQVLGIVWMQN
jgi:hypothetical protein